MAKDTGPLIHNVVLEAALKEIKKRIPTAQFIHRAKHEDERSEIHFERTNVMLWSNARVVVERRLSCFERYERQLPSFDNPKFRPQLLIDFLLEVVKAGQEMKALEGSWAARLQGSFTGMVEKMDGEDG